MKKTISLLTLIIIAFSMLCVPTISTAATPAVPEDITITRKVQGVTNPVTNTFTYTITADSNNPDGASNVPTAATIEFNAVSPDATHVATKTGVLNFSDASFSKLGTYKYTIKETTSTDSTTYPVVTDTYTICVQVMNEVDTEGHLTGNYIANVYYLDDEGDKATDLEFPRTAEFTNLTLTKTVSGNAADASEYFKFQLALSGTTGDVYTITGQDATVKYGGNNITTSPTYTVGQTNYVYLKAGQTITIGKAGDLNQIKIGSSYTITEVGASGYKTTIDGSTEEKSTISKIAQKDVTKNKTTFNNNKEEAAETGIFFNITSYIVLIGLAGVGIIALVRNSKKVNE